MTLKSGLEVVQCLVVIRSQITVHFHYHHAMGILGVKHFWVSGRFSRHSVKWLIMNPQHFESDAADIWIRIQINQKIKIRIPDHIWSSWRRPALSEHCQSV